MPGLFRNREIPTRLYEMYLRNGREELGLDPATEEGRGKIEQLKEGIVSELIDRTLIMDEAERRGLSIPPEKMEAAVARTVQQFGGADFAGLAREHSEDPSSREQGGDLGTFARGTHTRAFDEAAFALKPGAVSGVVQTEYGFHVIKVNAKEAARALTLAEATPEIRRKLLADLEATKLTETLKEMRRQAKVRINEPFRFGALKDEFPQK